jgi:hypothetical protein
MRVPLLESVWSRSGDFGTILGTFLLINVLLLILFAFVRVPFMDDKHFLVDTSTSVSSDDASTDKPKRTLARWGDSWYVSTMIQSTVGASDITPISSSARVVTAIQGFSVILSLGLMIVLMAPLLQAVSIESCLEKINSV